MPGDTLGSNNLHPWSRMSHAQRCRVVEQVAEMQCQLLLLHFPAGGALLLKSQFQNPEASGSNHIYPFGRFFIGAVIPYRASGPQLDHGPWNSSVAWVLAAINNYILRLEHAISNPTSAENTPLWTHALNCFKLLYNGATSCFRHPSLSDLNDSKKCPFIISHPDLVRSNVIIAYDDPARITGFIDWEDALLVPMWASTMCSRFIDNDEEEEEELHQIFRTIVRNRVPNYDHIYRIAEGMKLNDFLILANGGYTKTVPGIKTGILGWLDAIDEQYRSYFDELRGYLGRSKCSSKLQTSLY